MDVLLDEGRLRLRLQSERSPLDETAVPLLADVLSALNYHVAARKNIFRSTRDLLAFEGGVVDPHVQGLLTENVLFFGIPDHKVCIRSHRNGALPRVEPKNLRRCGARNLYETIDRDALGP